MGNFTYLIDSDNQARTATITPSSADTNYPVANVQNLPVSKPFRFTGKTSENLQIDLGSALVIDCVALIAGNLSTTATITLNGGSSSNPDGSEFTTPIARRQYDSFVVLSSPETYQYWKVIIADSNCAQAALQLGYLVIGDSTTLTFNFAPGWTQTLEHENVELESEYGNMHVAELFSRNRIGMSFNNISALDMTSLLNIQILLKRSLTPMLLVPDGAGTDCWFVRSISNFEQNIDFYRSASFEFLEESRGRFITA